MKCDRLQLLWSSNGLSCWLFLFQLLLLLSPPFPLGLGSHSVFSFFPRADSGYFYFILSTELNPFDRWMQIILQPKERTTREITASGAANEKCSHSYVIRRFSQSRSPKMYLHPAGTKKKELFDQASLLHFSLIILNLNFYPNSVSQGYIFCSFHSVDRR